MSIEFSTSSISEQTADVLGDALLNILDQGKYNT